MLRHVILWKLKEGLADVASVKKNMHSYPLHALILRLVDERLKMVYMRVNVSVRKESEKVKKVS